MWSSPPAPRPPPPPPPRPEMFMTRLSTQVNNNLFCQARDDGKDGEEKESEKVSPAGHRCNSASRFSSVSRLLKRLTTKQDRYWASFSSLAVSWCELWKRCANSGWPADWGALTLPTADSPRIIPTICYLLEAHLWPVFVTLSFGWYLLTPKWAKQKFAHAKMRQQKVALQCSRLDVVSWPATFSTSQESQGNSRESKGWAGCSAHIITNKGILSQIY